MRKFRQLDEALDWVVEAKTGEGIAERLKEWAASNQLAVTVVRLGVGAEKLEWNLPEGMPSTTKLEEDIPGGMGETTINLEWRRIKQFFDPQSNMNKLPDWKREINWVQILEGLHHKEAKLLTAIKDGKLLSEYPDLEKSFEILGITEYNTPVKKKTRSKKKAA